MNVNSFNETIALNLRFLREEKGLSVEDLASLSKTLSRALISKIENRKHKKKISSEYIELLASKLKINIDVLTEENTYISTLFDQLETDLKNMTLSDRTDGISEELYEICKTRGPRERFKAIAYKGDVEFKKSRYNTALPFFNEALEIALRSMDLDLIHKARHYLASTHLMLGHYSDVSELVQSDIKDNTLDSEKKANDYFLFGTTYAKQHKWEKAMRSFQNAVDACKEKWKNQMFESRCFQAMGDICKSKKDYQDAVIYSEKAIELAKESGDFLCEVYGLRTLAETQIETGQIQLAEKNLRSAHTVALTMAGFRNTEILKIEFTIALCEDNYERMKLLLSELENEELVANDIAMLYKQIAKVAGNFRQYEEMQYFYEKGFEKLEGK